VVLKQVIEKYLLALKCLLAAWALDKEHSKVHEQLIRFKQAIDQDAETLAPQTAQIIKSEFTLLPASTSLSQYNDDYLSRNKDCARRTLSALKARKLLSPQSAVSCKKDAVDVIKLPSITMEEAKEALELLRSWNSSDIDSFRSQAAAKWPRATAFSTPN
jgi:N-alpha-acetyltransferase 15/16, NatA auxiliary subunit